MTTEGNDFSSEKYFILETANIVHDLGYKNIGKKELIIEITKIWTKKTMSVSEVELNSVEFRSEFRYEIFRAFIYNEQITNSNE